MISRDRERTIVGWKSVDGDGSRDIDIFRGKLSGCCEINASRLN
jgi:hypothetical protein